MATLTLERAVRSHVRAALRAVRRAPFAWVGAVLGAGAGIATSAALRELQARARERRHPRVASAPGAPGSHAGPEEVARFIERATRVAAESIDWEATITHVARLALPFLGDVCAVVLVEDDRPRIVAVEHADPARTAELRTLLARYPLDREATHGAARIVRHARPELVPEVDLDAFAAGSDAGAPVRREILAAIGLRSYMGVPLVALDRTLGAMLFGITGGSRRYEGADLLVAQELATRCAVAIDHARLYRDAVDATRAREELLAVVSHDLRGPIAAVQLAASVVGHCVRRRGISDLLKPIATLGNAAARATRLVDDLVDWARLERGRLPLDRARHGAVALASQALSLAEAVAEGQGVRLVLDASPDAGTVDCDAHRVLQVLSNLIGNSLKAMPDGGVIRIGARRLGDDVVFDVSDTGPGIAPEDQPHVFERYWRSPKATYAGTGLGLAIARGIVESHGGTIRVRSTPGHGATFTFTLPAVVMTP